MKKTKLEELISSLSRYEVIAFRDFLNSPFFNKNEELLPYFNWLVQGKQNTNNERETGEISLYSNKKDGGRKTIDLTYLLVLLMEEFFSVNSMRKDGLKKKIKLLSEASERGMERVLKSAKTDVEVIVEKAGYRDHQYYHDHFIYMNELDRHFSRQARIERDKSLQLKADSLDIFYLSQKLKDSCEMMNRQMIMQEKFDFHFLDILLDYVSKNMISYSEYPAIVIYHTILKLFKHSETPQHLTELLELIEKSSTIFRKEELRDLYGYAQNYCIRRINAGEEIYFDALFDIYKLLLEQEVILQNGKLMQFDYKNIVSVALRLGEKHWALKFIKDYKDKIQEDLRENAYNYNLANYFYETKEFKKAIKLLQKVDMGDVYYVLDSRTLLMKMYFELEEDAPFTAQISAFKMYLRRNKLISAQNITLYSNLIKYAKKVYDLRALPRYRKKAAFVKTIHKLREHISSSKSVANSKWLLEKLGEELNETIQN